VRDQVGAGLQHVRRIGRQPGPDHFQLGGQLLLGGRLALLASPDLVPDRSPARRPRSSRAGYTVMPCWSGVRGYQAWVINGAQVKVQDTLS
jgi:hypothetical protein